MIEQSLTKCYEGVFRFHSMKKEDFIWDHLQNSLQILGKYKRIN